MSRIYENGRINWNAMRESQGVERRLEALHLGGGESSTSKRTSNLPQEVRNFLKLIANTENMVEAVVSLKFDINSSFDVKNIEKGYNFLREIEKEIEKKNTKGKTFKDAQMNYYKVIPHKSEPGQAFPPIDTLEKVKEEQKLLELLDDICRGAQVIDEAQRSTGRDKETIDVYYDSLHCSITRLGINRKIYKHIKRYLNATLKDHVNINNVFEVERNSEKNRFKEEGAIDNRWLLWHGSRIANFSSILSQGLRIAPPNVPHTGYMFGKGIYFADMAIKSYLYCKPKEIGETALLLLCEVELGISEELYESKYVTQEEGYDSVKGIGHWHPDHRSNKKIEGVTMPLGGPVELKKSTLKLERNEYIVYNVEQVKLRYIVEVTVKKLPE